MSPSSGAALAVGPLARDARALVVTDAASPRLHQENPRAVRTRPSADAESRAVVEYAATQLGARRLGLLHMDNAYGEGYRDPFRQGVAERGAAAVAITAYGEDPTSRTRAIHTSLAARPEALFFIGFGPSLARAIAEAKETGFDGAVFAAASIAYEKTRAGAPEGVEGTYFPDVPFDRATWNQRAGDLAERYRARWQADPPALVAMTHDALGLVFEGIAAVGPDPTAVLHWVSRRGDFSGVAGPGRVTPERDIVYELSILRLEDGVPKLVTARQPR